MKPDKSGWGADLISLGLSACFRLLLLIFSADLWTTPVLGLIFTSFVASTQFQLTTGEDAAETMFMTRL